MPYSTWRGISQILVTANVSLVLRFFLFFSLLSSLNLNRPLQYTYESIGCCRGLSSFQLLLFIHFMFLLSSLSLRVSFCFNDRNESTANGFLAQFKRNEPNKIVKRPRSDLFTTTNQLDSCPLLVSADCMCQTWVIVRAAVMVMRSIWCVVCFGHAKCNQTIMNSFCLRFYYSFSILRTIYIIPKADFVTF